MQLYYTFLSPAQTGHTAAHALLASAWQRVYHMPLPPLHTGAHGKPYVAAPAGRYFNLSHGKTAAACVLHTAEVGVDIEQIRPVRPRVVRRCYSPEEQAFLAACPADADEIFTRLWTAKEAYGKWLGVGVGYEMAAHTLLPPEHEGFVRRGEGWLWQKQIGGTVISIFTAAPPDRVEITEISSRGEK